jgi:UDP-N-acetylmuramoyl-tripeptide--D-alanyl-D-alanine ligase
MIFSASAIALATQGRLLREGPAGPVVTDSRRIPSGAWFFALAGDRFDGHQFLAHAAASGCAGAVVQHPPEGWESQWKGGLVQVVDTLKALQDLAAAARDQLQGPVVGITGSAGKTSTRVMVVDVLRALGHVHHTQGNLNNHIGLPLTLLAAPPDADAVVLEMGMNHRQEIALLAEIARPEIRLITNVGAAHVEGCGSIEGVALAKQELFDSARPGDVLCINMDDPRIAAMPYPEGLRIIRYGTGPQCTIRLTDMSVDPVQLQTRIRIETPDGVVRAVIPVPGLHLAHNAAAAVAVAFALRVPIESLSSALGQFAPEGMRNRMERLGEVLVIDDAYNANPVSVEAALKLLAAMSGFRVAVLGDMLELGSEEAAAHQAALATATTLGLKTLVLGPRMAVAARAYPQTEAFEDPAGLAKALAHHLQAAPQRAKALLIKGSRGSRMERVLEHLRAEMKCST